MGAPVGMGNVLNPYERLIGAKVQRTAKDEASGAAFDEGRAVGPRLSRVDRVVVYSSPSPARAPVSSARACRRAFGTRRTAAR